MSLIESIKSAGIIGAGGAGFPTHIKLDSQPDTVIVNGAECEPLLRVDQQLMAIYADKLAAALESVRSETGAKRAIFALKGKYHAAFEALGRAAESYEHIELFELPNFYPAGDEQITIYEVTGRIVPEGSIPISVGVVVLNVETLLNISAALEGRPVTHKYLTVTGEVARPCTLHVPIGITYREAIALAGGTGITKPAIIEGGPMMGKLTFDIDKPVVKNTKGLIVLDPEQPWVISKGRPIEGMLRQARTCCCHCMLCTEACPRHAIGHMLQPDKLMRIASYGKTCSDTSVTTAMLCCECGACEIACVMGLQPWKLNSLLKQQLAKNGVKNPHKAQPEHAAPFRELRRMSIAAILRRTGLSKYDVPAPMTDTDYAPKCVKIPLKQHIGAPSRPVVSAGDAVKAGQLIAEPAQKGPGITLHASIDGIVSAADDKEIVIAARAE